MRSQRTAILCTLTFTLILFAGATALAENANPTFVITGMEPAPGSLLPETPSIIQLTGSQPIHPSTVTSQTVKVSTAGPDGVFDTSDDVRVIPTSLVAVGSTIKIGLPVQATPRERYQVNVVSLTGVSTPVLTLLPTLMPTDVAFGDMNGDGNPDITVGNTERIDPTIFLGDGMGKFGAGISLPWLPGAVHAIVLADFNQDGMLDITGNAGAQVPILRNRGLPGTPINFAPVISYMMGTSSWVRAGDINGDGKTDLLSCNPGFNVRLNTTPAGAAALSFDSARSYPVESWQPAWEFQAGDLNGDGKLDIVSCHREGAVITALLNLTPQGSMMPAFSSAFTFATNCYAKYVELGDLNGDGKPDAVVANSEGDTLLVFLNTTEKNSMNVTFSPPYSFPATGSPSYISIADMDKDGKKDIVSAQSKSSESIVLLNTTQSGASVPTFAAPMRFPAGPMPVAAMGGDLTGKGHMGVVSACPTANCVAVTYLPTSVQTTSGINVDGEFSGTFPTGNGIAGGSFKATFDVGVPSTTPTTLSASASTVIYGDLGATLTASVTSPGQAVTSGVVTFQVMNGTIPAGPAISSMVSNGATSLAYTIPAALPASTVLTVNATYQANLSFGGSSASQQIVIQRAPLTVTAKDTASAYGTLPTFTGTLVGIKNNDPISATYNTNATQFSGTGSYPIVPLIGDPANKLGNYTVTASQATLLVTPALLLAAPHNNSRPYGASNPVLSGTLSGVLNGDEVQVVYESTATSRSAAGSYAITPRLLATEDSGNYALMPVTGMLSVTPVPLRAAATSATRAYGSDNPSFTGTVEGILNGDDVRVAFATQAASASPVGAYTITPQLIQTAAAGNYSFEAISASFTITPAALTIAAHNATRVYCGPNPVFSATISGARPAETIQLAFDTTAVQYSPVGTYTLVPRIADAAQAANYSVQTTNATLTVAKAAPTIVWPQPDTLAPGIALSATQLNARARDANIGAPLAGTYSYTPDIGAVLAVGTNELKLSFTPSDSVNYESATASTTIFIGNVTPPPTSPAGVAPSITSGLSATSARDFAFAYLITATGTAPIAFLAENLPPGFTQEGRTLIGTPSSAGAYTIKLTATNGAGSDTKFLNLTVSAPVGNHPPSWSSAPLATANPVLIGTPVTIVSQAVDPDGDSLHYVWEFGDGTVGSGASVSKTYSSAGTFTVKLTVTDGQTSITQNLNLQVAAQVVSQPISVQKVDVAFNFVRRNHSLLMSGKVPLHAGYEPTGTTVRIVVGGLDKTFVLNPKGASSDKTFKLKAARGQSLASFSLSLKDQALYSMLEGLGFSQTQSNTNVSFPVIVSVNGLAYSDEPVLRYTAKVGKSGPVSGRGKN